jgi:RimJ/RimL family protein N-acetyltransferase
LVIHKESRQVISASGYNEHTNFTKPCFEIGYWIDSTFSGQGLAQELVNALTRYALQGLGAIRTQICTQVENTKSTAVAERCRYVYEATLKHICLDCNSRVPADGFLYSCCDISTLPPLEVTWKQWPDEPIVDTAVVPQALPPQAQPLPMLQTKRLHLRAPRIQDADKLYMAIIASLNEVGLYYSWANKDLTRRQLQPHVDKAAYAGQNSLASENIYFLVWDKAQKDILGEICIKIVDVGVPNIQMSFWFDFRNIGNHDVCDVLEAVVQYAFKTRNVKCIQLYISEKNDRSLKLVRRLGFQLEGKLKNYFRNYVTNDIMAADTFSMTDFSQLKNDH